MRLHSRKTEVVSIENPENLKIFPGKIVFQQQWQIVAADIGLLNPHFQRKMVKWISLMWWIEYDEKVINLITFYPSSTKYEIFHRHFLKQTKRTKNSYFLDDSFIDSFTRDRVFISHSVLISNVSHLWGPTSATTELRVSGQMVRTSREIPVESRTNHPSSQTNQARHRSWRRRRSLENSGKKRSLEAKNPKKISRRKESPQSKIRKEHIIWGDKYSNLGDFAVIV